MNDDSIVRIRFADITAFNEAAQALRESLEQVKHNAALLLDILERAEASDNTNVE